MHGIIDAFHGNMGVHAWSLEYHRTAHMPFGEGRSSSRSRGFKSMKMRPMFNDEEPQPNEWFSRPMPQTSKKRKNNPFGDGVTVEDLRRL
jgi:hypothetical protein